MNQENFEIQKDYLELMQYVDKALYEKQMSGHVSYDTHKNVCDSFADVYAKQCVNHLLNDWQVMIVLGRAMEYCSITGNAIDNETVLRKLAIEILDKNSKNNALQPRHTPLSPHPPARLHSLVV